MTPANAYIEVAVALPVFQTFTYGVPENISDFIATGKRVLVPFGQRRVTGYILGPASSLADTDIKVVLDVLDERPLFPESMIPFFKWIAEYYKYPLGDVIKTALPGGLNIYEFISIALSEKGRQALSEGSVTPLESKILTHLTSGPCRLRDLSKSINPSSGGGELPKFANSAVEQPNPEPSVTSL